MAQYIYCEKVPITISIQFDATCIEKYDEFFKKNDKSNRVSHHISIKYLGYEENISDNKIKRMLDKLEKINVAKRKLKVAGFKVMKSKNSFFDDLLYLEIQPRDYLYHLHLQVINLLSEEIDYFETNDFGAYIPHISCGKFDKIINLDDLNKNISNKEIIDKWELVLHTSSKEYKII